MAGAWDAEDLTRLPHRARRRAATWCPGPAAAAGLVGHRRAPRTHRTTTGTPATIAHHYDLSNELFGLFLDESLTYSSALFEGTTDLHAGPAPQDRPAARRRRGRRGHPRARDRHRLGRARDPGGRPRCDGPHRSRCPPSSRSWPASGSPTPGCADRVQVDLLRLPRGRGAVRRRRVGRDDRGGRLRVLADLLPHPRPGPRTRWPGRPPGDHDAARPDARHPRHLHLDQQVHLPRRVPALRRGDRRGLRARHDAARDRPAGVRPATTPRRCAAGTRRSSPAARTCSTSASTRRSSGCGTSTSATRGPASPPATSTCSS